MKKFTFLLSCALFIVGITAHAQENQFNRWSIEVNAGILKPTGQFAPGYYTSTPSFFQGDVGIRYMLTNRFGLKASYGYERFENDDESLDFKTSLSRVSLEGVINAGDIFNFRDWSNTFNLLIHGGLGYSSLTPKEPTDADADGMAHIMAGITPQIRLSDHLALTLDGTAIGTIFQNTTFDGTSKSEQKAGVDGLVVNASIGFTVYLGSAEKHADWYNAEKDEMGTKLDSISERLAKVESDMQDSDKDGVPDYLDREPNTTNGVAVNSKGVAVDKNGNGIPDELEDSIDKRINKNMAGHESTTQGGVITDLINNGYVNVYFKFNSTQPDTYSLQSINYLITYMKNNSSAKADLIGYADEIGNPEYNKSLSEKRANKVKEIMVASGISADRLNVVGNGEDNSVDKQSSAARQLVRRVTFKLK